MLPLSSPLNTTRVCAVTVGATGIVAQTLLLREILAQFAGNELYVGLIIGIWIAAEAFGALLAGRAASVGRLPAVAFLNLTLLFSLVFPLCIFLARISKRIASLPPDQAATLLQVAGTAAALISPPAMLHGAQFIAATALFASLADSPQAAAGRAYAFDTLGTIAGGLLVSFLLLPNCTPFQSGALLLVIGATAAFRLRQHGSAAGPGGFVPPVMLLLAILLLAGGSRLDRLSHVLQWQGKELLYSINSPYQNIAVIRDREQHTVYTDGRPLFTFPDADIEAAELLAHLPLLAHRAPEKILLLGGGAGGLLAEILKYGTVRQVDYLELDPAILATVRKFADPASLQALADPRVRIVNRDGREFVKAGGGSYDIVLIGVPPPENLQENRCFSVEFFRRLSALLGEGGVLALSAPGSTAYYGPEMKRMTESLLATCQAAFAHARVIPGDRNLFLAANGPGPLALSAEDLAGRLAARGVATKLISEGHLRWLFDPSQLDWFRANIADGGVINSDLEPYLPARRIFQTAVSFNPALRPLLEGAGRLSTASLLPCAVLLAAAIAALSRYRPRTAFPYLIATSGFAAMILELVLMLLFQLVHGAMIEKIGLLTAVFMAGLWCGSMLTASERKPVSDFRWLAAGEGGVILLCSSLAMLFSVSGFTMSLSAFSGYVLILPLMLLSGFLTGMQFPPAVRLCGGEGSRAASFIYACDLGGACLGGFIGGLLLLPIVGFRAVLVLLVLLKTGSLIALLISATGGKMTK